MKYLLSISIGPVQDFIATARRSRDLWFGSWLLSELSNSKANRAIYECREGNVIPRKCVSTTCMSEMRFVLFQVSQRN